MAHFTAKGKRYELATIDSFSFDEARELKRISGFTTGPLIQALAETDPDAWLGLFVISIKRTEEISPDDLASENLIQMVDSVEADESPPAEGAKAPEGEESVTPAIESKSDGNGVISPFAEVVSLEEGRVPN